MAYAAADAFVDAAASLAQLPFEVRQAYYADLEKAKMVLRRAAAILAHVAALPVDPARVTKPRRGAPPKDVACDLATQHRVAVLASGQARCTRCSAFVPNGPRSRRRWWRQPCPGKPEVAASGPHPSHRLAFEQFVVYCQGCGAWAVRAFVRLRRLCPGAPTRAGEEALRFFRRGLLPPRAGAAADLSVE